MSSFGRNRALVGLIGLMIVGACGAPAPSPTPSPTPRPTGGVLRLGMDLAGYEMYQKNEDGTFDSSWDPSATWAGGPFALFHCCLLRTLMAYNGRAAADGGGELQPDLADGYPEISPDGLTWTFRIKPGLTYAPPMATVPITSDDFVRALERTLRQHPLDPRDYPFPFGPYSNYFGEVIEGATEFTEGASSISGLEARDPLTLVIHLKQPAGDLGARLAMPAAAPIPPGAANGHDTEYGRHLIANGPYMVEGSDQLQPGLPADQQPPVSGYVPGISLTLVRNPSWDDEADPLRAALPDRIEIVNVAFDDQFEATLNDAIDIGVDLDLFPEDLDGIRDDPQLAERIHRTSGLATDWIMLNLAVPPFDDLHVRRAIQFATDRKTLLDIVRPGGIVQSHAIPDIFSNGLLADYDPYGAFNRAGDPQSAAAEIAQSAYDTNGDGVCDDVSCDEIELAVIEERPELLTAAEEFADQMAGLGLTFSIVPVGYDDYWPELTDPASHVPIAFTAGWGADYLNGSSFFTPLARRTSSGTNFGLNLSLIGASAQDLASWGYEVSSVPSLDSKIDECVALTGAAQFTCWAEADQYAMERVAAWIPIGTRQVVRITSSRVLSFEFDDSTSMPSFGRIQVTP